MDKIKSLLNKEAAEESNPTGTTGRLTGQGSHFPKDDQSETTSSGFDRGTHGGHPTGPTSIEELGTVAIAGTSTYSSRHLSKGDTLGSIIDPTSTDPTTYKMPEHTYPSNTGVPAGSAETAATLAFNKDIDPRISDIPGAYPKDDSSTANPTREPSEPFNTIGRESATGGNDGYGTAREQFNNTGRQSATAGNDQYGTSREPFSTTGGESTTSGDFASATSREPFGTTGAEVGTAGGAGYGTSRKPVSTTGAEAGTAGDVGSGTHRAPYSTTGGEYGNTGYGTSREPLNAGATGAGTSGDTGYGTSREPSSTTGLFSAHDATTLGSSNTASTSSPVDRSADSAAAPHETSQSGTFGKVLGAVGLGGAAGGVAGAESRAGQDDRQDVVRGTPSQPTTTTGLDSYTAPTQSGPSATSGQPTSSAGQEFYGASSESGPPSSRYRKESIPTTAYPAGQYSPAPINPPVGGTSEAADDVGRHHHTGRDAGLAAAGVGAGALGAHEYERHRSQRDDGAGPANQSSTGQTPSSAAPYAPATSSSGRERETANTREAEFTSPYDTAGPGPERDAGYGRTAAAAGLGAGAGAAGAYGLENYRNEAETGDLRGQKPYTTTQAGSHPQANTAQLPIRETTPSAAMSGSTDRPIGSTSAARFDPAQPGQDDRHLGRDAALAGAAGTGAAGYAAYEQRHHQEQGTGYGREEPISSSSDNRTGAPSGTAATTYGNPTSREPISDFEKEQRHPGRDAALAGAAGTAGYAAYEQDRHRPEQATAYGREEPISLSRDNRTGPPSGAAATTYEKPTSREPDSEFEKEQRHPGRDAALAGAAGTGAAGYGAYEEDKHRPEQAAAYGREQPTTSSRDNRTEAAPATGATTSEKPTNREPTIGREKEQRHEGRDAALAGAAGAGAGVLGEHEYNKHESGEEAAKAEAQRQKDLAEQEAARQKQYEKDQKTADKLAAKEEKQHAKVEKKIQKEHEKEEKKHHKEIEKEEKHHQKELTAAETEHQRGLEKEEKERVAAQEAERKRHEKEAAGAAAVGTGAAAYGVHEHDKKSNDPNLSREEQALREPGSGGHAPVSEESDRSRLHKDPPQQKKPGFFKRIFKSRKNKDTGEDEQYSTDEEDNTPHGHHHAAEATAAGAGVGGAGLAAEADRQHEHDTAASGGSQTGRTSYEAQSGGLQKPSYNPFSKQDPSAMGVPTTANKTADTNLGTGVGTNQYDAPYETRPGEATTGTHESRGLNEGRLGQSATGAGATSGAGGTY